MEQMWAWIPEELLTRILSRISDFTTLVAVSGVCRPWRKSVAWAPAIGFNESVLKCKKHGRHCSCAFDCLVGFMSRSKCILGLDLYLESARRTDFWDSMERCSGSLEKLRILYPEGTDATEANNDRILQVLSGCKGLHDLTLKHVLACPRDGSLPEQMPVLTNLKALTIFDYLPPNYLQSILLSFSNLEELVFLCRDDFYPEVSELSLDAPLSLKKLKVYAQLVTLKLRAPGLRYLTVDIISGLDTLSYLHIEEAPLLENLTFSAATCLAKGPSSLESVTIKALRSSYLADFNSSLWSCQTVPWIKSLKVCPDLTAAIDSTGRGHDDTSSVFFKTLSVLNALEVLELNVDLVMQLVPEDQTPKPFLPKLKILRFNCPTAFLPGILDNFQEVLDNDEEVLDDDDQANFISAWRHLRGVLPHDVQLELVEDSEL